jgi:mono/diheme cytochrome c family protein
LHGTTEGGLRKALFGSALLSIALAHSGCGPEGLSPSAARGRQVYLGQCIACHAMDPAQPGPVGPPVKGASRELLEAKVLKGTYPPGYKPKRLTAIMPPQPQVAPDIDALADFLK